MISATGKSASNRIGKGGRIVNTIFNSTALGSMVVGCSSMPLVASIPIRSPDERAPTSMVTEVECYSVWKRSIFQLRENAPLDSL